MSPQKALLGIALVFVLGIVTGVGLSIRLIKERTHAIAAGTPQDLGRIVAMRLGAELKLDARQRVAVQNSATDAFIKLRALRSAPAEEAAIEQETRKAIDAILTPEQRKEWEATKAEE